MNVLPKGNMSMYDMLALVPKDVRKGYYSPYRTGVMDGTMPPFVAGTETRSSVQEQVLLTTEPPLQVQL